MSPSAAVRVPGSDVRPVAAQRTAFGTAALGVHIALLRALLGAAAPTLPAEVSPPAVDLFPVVDPAPEAAAPAAVQPPAAPPAEPSPAPEPPAAPQAPPPMPQLVAPPRLPAPPRPRPARLVPTPSARRSPSQEAVPPQAHPAPAAAPSSEAIAPAAPASPAPSDPNAVPAWQGRLLGQLQRAERYPDAARQAGQDGVALVGFTMDRAGQVLAVRLVRSSGSPALDGEAVAVVRRAGPLPAPPPEMPGQTLTLTVPIRFTLQ